MSEITVKPIRDAIKAACVSAWDLSVDDVTYGNPRVPEPKLPYSVIRLESVPMTPEGVVTVEQTYVFEILYVGNWGQDEVIEDLKVDKANALIGELMTSATFADVANDPMIHEVSFAEVDDANEPTYELTITFSVALSQMRLV